MANSAKAEALFRPIRSKAESKHDTTDNAARSIIDAETARREAKTARLREARLAQEATAQPEPVAPRTKRRAAKA